MLAFSIESRVIDMNPAAVGDRNRKPPNQAAGAAADRARRTTSMERDLETKAERCRSEGPVENFLEKNCE